MSETSAETKKKLLESAKKEFLEKGFVNASLRTIAANAGVTTGAMYRHFKDKDAFFCALVDEAIEVTTKAVMTAGVMTHAHSPSPVTKEHRKVEDQVVNEFLDYIYANFDAFTLLVLKSAGSTHEKFIDEMCDLYTKNCVETFNWMYKQKYAARKVDEMTVHVLASSIINSFVELISHQVPKKQAVKFINNIHDFFHYGCINLLEMKI